MDELPLFPDAGAGRADRWVKLRQGVRRLARAGVWLGTSSWKYPGWLGWLYSEDRYWTRGKFSTARFERECLREYAEVFGTVSVDAGYYAFPTAASIEKLRAQVPEEFLFSFKVTDEITLRRFPALDRFGARAGQVNPHFLDAALFRNAFLAPLAPYRRNVGVLMFEFARFAAGTWAAPSEFAAALDAFFYQLPTDWQYGVELRNPELFHPDCFAVLARHGVAHVFNSWQAMPPIEEQMEVPGAFTTDFAAARLLLKPGRAYEQAVRQFSPYDRLQEPLPATRAAAAALIRRLAAPPPQQKRRRSFLFVNNRLEGHALESLLAIIALAEASEPPPAEDVALH